MANGPHSPLPALMVALTIAACDRTPAHQPVRGFPADAIAALAQRESVLTSTPDTARLRAYMLAMTEEPHHAGSPGAKAVAEYALARFREWGLDAQIEEFEALLPMPVLRRVELVSPTRFVARMNEPAIPEDKDSGDEGMLPTSTPYAADGDVTGDLVFANYGLPEDYALLDERKIDLRGKVVIVKYSRGVRSAKIKQAAERGAVAVLIYSDPKEDGFARGDVYPKGPWRPADGVQRGTALDYAAMYPGDPLTPGWGAKAGARKLPRSEARSLPKIPVAPLSYGDAEPLLAALDGPAPPNDWKGALNVSYKIGPGPARVRVTTKSDWKVRPLYNVVGRIPGAIDPDQWVVFANHHDGWVHGADDPVSGAVALMETARSFSELLKTGWRPRRTLIFALWDGEEWGLLGSTEWAEEHAEELRQKAVAYLNTDSYSAGRLNAGGSHTLTTFVRQVARDVVDPITGRSAADVAIANELTMAKTAADSGTITTRGFRVSPLGSGTDFEAFLEHLGVPSVDYGFDGAPTQGAYHSIYDSYDHFTRFVDPGFVYGRAQAAAVGTFAMRLAEAPLLPFSFTDAADAFRGFADDVSRLAGERLGPEQLDMSPVLQAIERLDSSGAAYDRAYEQAIGLGSASLSRNADALRAINVDLYRSEQDLLSPAGLPGREWFKHTMYATGVYTGFAPDPMPGVRQMIQAGRRADAQAEAVKVAEAIDRMASRAGRLGTQLGQLGAR